MNRLIRLLVTCCLLGAVLPAGLSLAQDATTPVFEPMPCPFPVPEGFSEGENLTCGYVTVLERHANPAGPTIRLGVAVFHNATATPEPDPIIFITGGPGGQSLELYTQEFNASFGPIFATNRDFILYDQRGVGTSEPALDCPQFAELYLDALDYDLGGEPVTNEEILAGKVTALEACAADLRQIADLSAYNTLEGGLDLIDLRVALEDAFGYEGVNLWGSSYGTWVALEALRQNPAGIRSVILDAPVTPEANLYLEMPLSYIHALETLFAWCAEDEACATAYPDLEETYYAAIERLNAEPVLTDVMHPYTGARYPVLMTGDMFAETVFRALYLTPLLPAMPGIIADAEQGTFNLLLAVVRQDVMRQDWRSWGMYLSVMCHDEYPFNAQAEFEAVIAPYPALAGMFTDFEVGGLPYEGCPVWDVEAADPALNQPVRSEIPTLILTGELDPIVPPDYGSLAAGSLPNSTLLVFPGVGHGGSSGGPCPLAILTAFVQDPTAELDLSCMDAMTRPPFQIASQHADVTMVPFSNAMLGLQGLEPEGWESPAPGSYARLESELDTVGLAIQPLPLPVTAMPGFFQQRLSLEAPPESVAEREINGLAWQFYALEVQGLGIDFAVAGVGEDSTLLVLLQAPASERETLYAQVFLPAVEALIPLE